MSIKTNWRTAPSAAPIEITITFATPEHALVLWAALLQRTSEIQELADKNLSPENAKRVSEMLDLGISEGTYPLWNALDDLLKARGVIRAVNDV